MAKIPRATQIVFSTSGLTPTDGFGAAAAELTGTEIGTSNSVSNLQSGGVWAQGWLPAVLGASKFPAVEDMNALGYVFTAQLAYILQQGIAEYDAGTTYFIGGLCTNPGTAQIYVSQTDNNTGNSLSNATYWVKGIDLNNSGSIATGMIQDFAGPSSAVPTGFLLCYGQAVSRTTYANLFAVIGTTWGVGDGTTTFNLPDLRGIVTAGVDNMGGTAANRITSGVSGITGTTLGATGGDQNLFAHSHTATITDPGHHHTYTSPGSGVAAAGSPNYAAQTVTGVSTSTATTGVTVANSTTGTGVGANVQPTAMINKIIKT